MSRLVGKTASNSQLFIAYSGGLDSQVLLHLAINWARKKNVLLTALHVNHGLSEHADSWQVFCEQQCQNLNVPIVTKKLTFLSHENLENRARNARYTWFSEQVTDHSVLLMAHHQDDQAETVLLRLLRASAARGLSAIPSIRRVGKSQLIRPLLGRSKKQLQQYAKQQALAWVEDESNQNLGFDRNYIRHQVMPTLLNRWPKAAKLLAVSAKHVAEDVALLDDLAQIDIKLLGLSGELSVRDAMASIQLSGFNALSEHRRKNIIRYLLLNKLEYPLSDARLKEWLKQCENHHREAHTVLTLDTLRLALFDGKMYFLKPATDLAKQEISWVKNEPLSIPVLGCTLFQNIGERKKTAQSITINRNDNLCVRWRQGGERFVADDQEMTRSLKKVMQEKRIAPWLRNELPLVWYQDRIVWSAAFGEVASVCNELGQSITFALRLDNISMLKLEK